VDGYFGDIVAFPLLVSGSLKGYTAFVMIRV